MDYDEFGGGRRDRNETVRRIVAFVSQHPNSYASLAVCRRALDSGIEVVDPGVVAALSNRLQDAPADEIEAYYSIVM